MDKKYDDRNRDQSNNTFGGIRYRFSYDDVQRELHLRSLRQSRLGAYRFAMTAAAVSLFCCAAVTSALLYRTLGEESTPISVGAPMPEQKQEPVHNVDFRDCGGFMVENLEEHIPSVYHIPQGVIVTNVTNLPAYPQNIGKLILGDVIVSVDGGETPDITTFVSRLPEESRQIKLVVYREGEYVDVSYVID